MFTDLGLYYYRARWHDPELGTFLETDPIGELDYINLYSYVGLNPLNATDPTGMESGSFYGTKEQERLKRQGKKDGDFLAAPFLDDIKGDAASMGMTMANFAINQYQSGAITQSQFDLQMTFAYDAMENAAVLPATNGHAIGQAVNSALIFASFRSGARGSSANQILGQRVGVMRDALSGKLTGNVTLPGGAMTLAEMNHLGNSFVGPGAKLISGGKGLESADGLRVFRFPVQKSYGGTFGNLEVRSLPKGSYPVNIHVEVIP